MSKYECSNRGPFLQTFTGRAYYLFDPRPEEIDIIDIAHSLANQCRFGGSCDPFYSVAEHSVRVSLIVPTKHAFAALMHDATEAYVIDVPRPLKLALGSVYADIEARAWKAICHRFGIDEELPPEVKHADEVMLATEKRGLMANGGLKWADLPEPLPESIDPWSSREARARFVSRFFELGGRQ